MHLFGVIPDRLFSVLAAPSRAVYAHVLFLLFDLHRLETYGIPREAIIDAVADFIETADLPDDDELVDPNPETESLTPRDKANAILRRLQETGWIDIEQRSDYQQFINIADYAVALLDTLDRIRRQERSEYAGYVLATFTVLTSDEVERNPGLIIDKAFDQTQRLVRDLKSLHDNIKRYTERLLTQKEPKEILAMHFGDYKLEVLDRSYHRLKTTDNVSKFRPRILERIDNWLSDPGWLTATANDEVRRGRLPTQDEAEQSVLERLSFIRNCYERMDELIDEIDRRNAQYAKASFEHVQYLLSSSGDTSGKLVALIKLLGAQLRSGDIAVDQLWPEAWAPIFRLQSLETWEETSLFTPRAPKRNLHSQPLEIADISTAERSAAQRKLHQQLAAKLTYRRVDDYVAAQLGDRRELRAADLGIANVEDYIRLIYVAAYGRSRRVRFAVEFDGDQTTAVAGRFSFKNIRIRRK